MQLAPGKRIYFLSDFHLGAPDHARSLVREKHIVAFLERARQDAAVIFVVGDLFDFWYEYRTVVPKGYTRILGKLAEITDSGIPVHFFTGNHDMWMRGYFEEELGIPVYHEPKTFEFNGVSFYIGHGDGLGPGDHGYKFMKKIFRNPVCQWLFGLLPPAVGVGLANWLSRRSRAVTGAIDERFLGEEKEWLIIYAKEVLATAHYDYFIFGHRHLPIDWTLHGGAGGPVGTEGTAGTQGLAAPVETERTQGLAGPVETKGTQVLAGPIETKGIQVLAAPAKASRYINLGDWIRYNTYAVFDGTTVRLLAETPEMEGKIVRK